MSVERSLNFSEDTFVAVSKFAEDNHITFAEAVRRIIDEVLAYETLLDNQDEIRKLLRKELDGQFCEKINPYIKRLLKMNATAVKGSIAELVINAGTEEASEAGLFPRVVATGFLWADNFMHKEQLPTQEYLRMANELISACCRK